MDIKEILEKHERWLKGENSGVRANLSGANLTGANLTAVIPSPISAMFQSNTTMSTCRICRVGAPRTPGLYLSRLSGKANLSEADLSWANLTRADLTKANLTRANLTRADLTKANLTRANLSGADLTRADLTGANLFITCWPLWCGTKDVKVDLAIAAQLAAHFCVLDCDDPAYTAAREKLLPLARGSIYASDLEIE